MFERQEARNDLLSLASNWGNRGFTAKQIDTWLDEIEAGGWTNSEVRTACKRCRQDKSRIHAPQSFGEFSNYLPPRRKFEAGDLTTSDPWWHIDGTWGGDWSRADRGRMLGIAGSMLGSGFTNARARRDQFVAMTLDAGWTMDEVRAAAKAFELGHIGGAMEHSQKALAGETP